MKQQPEWLDKKLFPFDSKWIDVDGQSLHYIDEGKGEVILFVHGTPEWSFGFRDLIKELRTSFRCVSPDLLGFGLSEKPLNGDYSVTAHAGRLEKFIAALALTKLSIVANDFGGGIALNYAIHNPSNIGGIVLFNTWMWSLKNDPHYAKPAKLMRSWLGRMLYLNFNFAVNVVMPASFGDRKKLTPEIHAHYQHPLTRRRRTATYRLAHELIDASDWWEHLWQQMRSIEDKPFLFFWGLKDKFVPSKELDKWKSRLPHAKVVVFDDAGHFVQEEKPREMSAAIQAFMTGKDSARQ